MKGKEQVFFFFSSGEKLPGSNLLTLIYNIELLIIFIILSIASLVLTYDWRFMLSDDLHPASQLPSSSILVTMHLISFSMSFFGKYKIIGKDKVLGSIKTIKLFLFLVQEYSDLMLLYISK